MTETNPKTTRDDPKRVNESAGESMCGCTHPTHFLGRCEAEVTPPETRCAECMENHFHRVDDPAI